MSITAVIFDFDGVLADTERLHLRAIQDALASFGRTLDERAYFERFLGFGDRDVFVEFAREIAWTLGEPDLDRLMTLKADRYRHHLAAGSALYPAAAGCISGLGARYLLGIASGSLHAEIEHILTASGLAPAFRAIVGADDVARGKPAPEPYLKAAELLGVRPSNAVAIEDSRWGLESARAAGMHTIGLTTTYPRSALAVADRVVDSLDELSVEFIGQLGS